MEKKIALNGKLFTRSENEGLHKWWEQIGNYPELKKWAFDWLVVNIPKQIWDENEKLREQAEELLLNGESFNKDGSINKSRNWCMEIMFGYSDDFPELGNNCKIVSLRETDAWQ